MKLIKHKNVVDDMNSIKVTSSYLTEYRNVAGALHREDGPALEYSSRTKCWYINGKFHRVDGPAIEYTNGSKAYWLNGRQYSYKDWDRLRKLLVFS